MDERLKRVPARFFRTAAGTEPVREWLLTLGRDDRQRIGTDVATVEYGWPVGMPTCRPMGGGLFEVRSDLDGHRIARLLFCVHDGEMILLHGFLKKTQKTPAADLELARRRQREVTR